MVTLRVKSGLFQFHLDSAARFAFACMEIENEVYPVEFSCRQDYYLPIDMSAKNFLTQLRPAKSCVKISWNH